MVLPASHQPAMSTIRPRPWSMATSPTIQRGQRLSSTMASTARLMVAMLRAWVWVLMALILSGVRSSLREKASLRT